MVAMVVAVQIVRPTKITTENRMPYYLSGKEYLNLLSDAIGKGYLHGQWHPEDIGSAVEFANHAVEKTLTNLNDNGSRFRWKQQSLEDQSS
jgi:hypothetical protein